MSNIWKLFKEEIVRIFKYKIFYFSIGVTFIWLVILALVDSNTAKDLAPTLILMDAGIMSIVLLGSSFFLEKQEGIYHSLFVTPIPLYYVIVAKILSAIFMAIISYVLITMTLLIFHGIVINYLLLLLAVILTVFSHTAIGYLITLYSKDFMTMLTKYMVVMLAFFVPIFLLEIGIIPLELDYLCLISPSYAAQYLFEGAFINNDVVKEILSCLYLIIIGISLYPLVIVKKFAKEAILG